MEMSNPLGKDINMSDGSSGGKINNPDNAFTVPFNVFLSKGIGDSTKHVIRELIYWENENARNSIEGNPVYPIILHINSPGGSVYEMIAIIDTINGIETPVVTYAHGHAMSAAALILMSGTPGNRLISKNSWVMLHQISNWVFGSFPDMEKEYSHSTKLNNQLIGIIAKCCKKSKKQIKELIERDFYMTAKQAVKFGIADNISPVPKVITDIPNKFFKTKKKSVKSKKKTKKKKKK